MAAGREIVEKASSRIGQEYVLGARAPLNRSDWQGPWDCAELCSWALFQVNKRIYGCTRNTDPPETANPWTKSWKRDAENLGEKITWEEAATIPGAMLLRRTETAGHIAISTGKGNETIEARGRKYGVVNHVVNGRGWHFGVLIDTIDYEAPTDSIHNSRSNFRDLISRETTHTFEGDLIRNVQVKLSSIELLNHDTGVFDISTESALATYQNNVGLTPHGMLDFETLLSLGVKTTASATKVKITK